MTMQLLEQLLASKVVARVHQDTFGQVAMMVVTFEDGMSLAIRVVGLSMVIELSGRP
jgi:hypothetical protein